MSVIEVKPFMLNDLDFLVEDDDYAGHCSQIQFTPTTTNVVWKGLKKSSKFTFPTGATWVATLALAQDWETADSLSRYLHDHEGEEKDVTLRPRSGVGPSFTATLIIAPGAIGGVVDTVAASTVTLGIQGRPELVPA